VLAIVGGRGFTEPSLQSFTVECRVLGYKYKLVVFYTCFCNVVVFEISHKIKTSPLPSATDRYNPCEKPKSHPRFWHFFQNTPKNGERIIENSVNKKPFSQKDQRVIIRMF
jgi:hypothetical protein